MSEGPKRFSLSDYQSKRGTAKPIESAVQNEQRSELEELHMLLGTSLNNATEDLDIESNDPDILHTPGASPRHDVDMDSKEDIDKGVAEVEGEGENDAVKNNGTNKTRGNNKDGGNKHGRRERRRSRRNRSRRSRSGSSQRSRSSRAAKKSSQRRSRSRSSSSESSSSDPRISMRCVFPYEDGGVIIGLRGTHLSKLRRITPDVDWRISNETDDKQDRVVVVRGSVKKIAEAFRELAEHFISQGMHIDYPTQLHGRGSNDVDSKSPLVPVRLLVPHKTCGAIIGQKSETLINTRVNCRARRVYVYRERISDSRERIVEIVGTPKAVERVVLVIGNQVARTLDIDQQESDLYRPERDGLRNFLNNQGVPRSRITLEPIRQTDWPSKSGRSKSSSKGKRRDRSRSPRSTKSRNKSRSRSRSKSKSRSRSRHRSPSHRRHRRSSSRHRKHSRSRSHKYSRRGHRSSRAHYKNLHSRRGKSRSRSRSRDRSESASRSRSRSHNRSRSRSRSYSRSPSPARKSFHSKRSTKSKDRSFSPANSRSRSRSGSRSMSISQSRSQSRNKRRNRSRDRNRRRNSKRSEGANRENNGSKIKSRPIQHADSDVEMKPKSDDGNAANIDKAMPASSGGDSSSQNNIATDSNSADPTNSSWE